MPWKENKTVDLQPQLIQDYNEGESIAGLAEISSVLRKTIYKWLERHDAGPVSVTVMTQSGTSAVVNTTASLYGPAFFLWPGSQVVATRQDCSYAVAAGTFAGVTKVPAKPGDVLILWATGFGPTNPLAPDGVEVSGTQTYSTSTPPIVMIDNIPATVYGAALASGSVGLYQIAIQVPTTLANGN
jgi:uncharacterized protein (TIGR03437 family)